ncbi:hypothetical protein L218DRAFT_1004766 [Marasmius fiardii PR-910]|nr:hypothetical protein L218DRAFT_1004766 [Marasmius fiardii PR-910]
MTENERGVRGLPHFIPEIRAEMMRWAAGDHEFIQELQAVKSVDSTTTDFACLAGIPLLELVPKEGRFSDIPHEIDSHPCTSAGDHDGIPMDVDNPSGVGIDNRAQPRGNMLSIRDLDTNMDINMEGHSLSVEILDHSVGVAVDD